MWVGDYNARTSQTFVVSNSHFSRGGKCVFYFEVRYRKLGVFGLVYVSEIPTDFYSRFTAKRGRRQLRPEVRVSSQQLRWSTGLTQRRFAADEQRHFVCELTAKFRATSVAVIGSSAGTGMARPRKKRAAGCVAWGSAGGNDWKSSARITTVTRRKTRGGGEEIEEEGARDQPGDV